MQGAVANLSDISVGWSTGPLPPKEMGQALGDPAAACTDVACPRHPPPLSFQLSCLIKTVSF